MKKLLTCAGLAAVGATGLQAQYLGDAQPKKPWNVSARIQGFYDSNYPTLPKERTDGGPVKRASYGFSVNPWGSYTLQKDLTSLGVRYEYDLRYFDDRNNNKTDQSHKADVKLGHAFSERFKLDLSDGFVVAQEPEVIDPTVRASFLRTDGNNMRNTGSIGFTADITQKLFTRFGYSNTFYDYEQKGDGSRSALLDRMEHLGSAELRWQFRPTTTGLIGYQYGMIDQTSKEFLVNRTAALNIENIRRITQGLPILVGPAAAAFIAQIPTSSIRDNRSHYLFTGLDHHFTEQLAAHVRVGAEYTEYPNAIPGSRDNNMIPYADGKVTYRYAEGSSAELGIKHARNQTDVAILVRGPDSTLDQESTTIWGGITHKITARLEARLRGQMQSSTFNQGTADKQQDNYYALDAFVAFEVNKFVFAEAGWEYDRLDSDVANRGFSRNRIFIGVRATY